MNTLMTIQPYRHLGGWAFDDASVGLKAEPFIAGMPAILNAILRVNGLRGVTKFRAVFAGQNFPGAQAVLYRHRPEAGGWWYHYQLPTGDTWEGWLCPALFKYFKTAPRQIHIKVEK